jgi:hypothetical protein
MPLVAGSSSVAVIASGYPKSEIAPIVSLSGMR